MSELCKEDEEKDNRPLFGSRSVGSHSSSKIGNVPSAEAILEEEMCLFNSRGPRSQSKRISAEVIYEMFSYILLRILKSSKL